MFVLFSYSSLTQKSRLTRRFNSLTICCTFDMGDLLFFLGEDTLYKELFVNLWSIFAVRWRRSVPRHLTVSGRLPDSEGRAGERDGSSRGGSDDDVASQLSPRASFVFRPHTFRYVHYSPHSLGLVSNSTWRTNGHNGHVRLSAVFVVFVRCCPCQGTLLDFLR